MLICERRCCTRKIEVDTGLLTDTEVEYAVAVARKLEVLLEAQGDVPARVVGVFSQLGDALTGDREARGLNWLVLAPGVYEALGDTPDSR